MWVAQAVRAETDWTGIAALAGVAATVLGLILKWWIDAKSQQTRDREVKQSATASAVDAALRLYQSLNEDQAEEIRRLRTHLEAAEKEIRRLHSELSSMKSRLRSRGGRG